MIILANHGTVSFGQTVEKAYWWTEILDAYCRMLMLARGLGSINYFSEPEAKALLNLKQKWGLADPRLEMTNCDICANDVFRESWKTAGVKPKAFQPPTTGGARRRPGSTRRQPRSRSPDPVHHRPRDGDVEPACYLILHFGSACRNCAMPSRLTLV